ncbi:hypothetical protein K2173_018539 [Erythroxylum novogranatense]|uniref:C2H2-type domain-containing protein n=1 Tax=Erythroxylum novogranatense TaxID=1862640 RepID=A0AAV8UAQ8_9ROSI|nr:hypothetical protein K2173_018539 [Erythroxylum novogranatense]
MEFWGVEVKSGSPLRVECGGEFIIHLSQASLGELKKEKGNEPVFLYVTIGDKKLVLGTLSAQKFPQLSFDLVFEKDFELSHNCKHGSVYFFGYKAPDSMTGGIGSESDDESEENLPIANDSVGRKSEQNKPTTNAAANQTVRTVKPNNESEEDADASDDEEDDSLSDDDSGDQGKTTNVMDDVSDEDDDDDESDEDDESEDEDERKPDKVEAGKKRLADSTTKTPVHDKKVKLVTPQKTDTKKVGVHVATPHPSKQVLKTPANSDQNKGQISKTFACKSCNRSFGSENALQSHTKAKHSAAQ